MKQILFLPIFISLLFGVENTNDSYENYEVQNFFSATEVHDFITSTSGELLKKIVVDGEEFLMQQDGDLFEEDVATIQEEIFSAKSSSFSFGKSKRLLATKVYPTHQKAFYSNCDYTVIQKKLVPLHKTCGFTYRKNKNRSERIEWEHVVPAWHFGHQLRCWQNGGRMTCRQTNNKFKQMEADMHNLVPAIGEINGDRSNFRYSMISKEQRAYGKVDMEILFSEKKAEPMPSIYGDIARTYFYMRDRYGLKISKSQEKMFIAWNNLDPVSKWEKKKNTLIYQLQGDDNNYVSNYKKLEQLGDIPEDLTPQSKIEKPTEFQEIENELSENYSFILDKLPVPIAGIILFLMTLFTLYQRNKPKEKKRKKEKKKSRENMEDQPFMIISQLGDVAISYNQNNEIIIEKTDQTNPKQQWAFNKANQQKDDFFIENITSGQVIEVQNADSNDGANIILAKKKKRNNDHQEWDFEEFKDKNYFFLLNKSTLNVLDVKYKTTKDGTKLQSFHKKIRGTENQTWKIQKN